MLLFQSVVDCRVDFGSEIRASPGKGSGDAVGWLVGVLYQGYLSPRQVSRKRCPYLIGGENAHGGWRVDGRVGCVPRQALKCCRLYAGTSVSREDKLFRSREN